ncbi:MAG: hypothetical protein EOP56_06225 [Sphingobacteriales bacterium]|nr:MAG: hypothetical protein EOP56_06225 [Sphingobacteriales bacterium]
MRTSLLTILSVLFCLLGWAQPSPNHIPNGNFEQYHTCPTGFAQVRGYCKNWRGYSAGTSDFFHACNGGTYAGVPTNQVGTQAAADGLGYGGIITYLSYLNYREYLSTDITPMVPGLRYDVSFSISLADLSDFATDGIGMFFYDEFYDTIGVLYPLDFIITPQLSFNSYGVDTAKTTWLRMSASYIPDSAYDHIIIGNFNNNSNTTIVNVGSSSGHAYYYIDSVVIKRNPYIKYNFNPPALCAGDTINIPYIVESSTHYSLSNVFTLELSNASGSFASPTVIGTLVTPFTNTIRGIIPTTIPPGSGYRVRIVASSPGEVSLNNGYDITIRPLPAVSGSSNSPICENSTLNLSATSPTGTGYTWVGPNGFTSTSSSPFISLAKTIHSGAYTVRATLNGCFSSPYMVHVVVNKPSTIGAYASPDDTIMPGEYGTIRSLS